MRTIKFRAWDTLKKIMVEDTGVPHTQFTGNKHLTYLQFTGLTDKNGKEIYEGDVIEEIGVKRDDGKNQTFQVVFQNGAFGDIEESFNEINGEYLVIGNIYENPELIKPL